MKILDSSCEVLVQITPFTQECTTNLSTCDVTHGRGFGKKLMGLKGLWFRNCNLIDRYQYFGRQKQFCTVNMMRGGCFEILVPSSTLYDVTLQKLVIIISQLTPKKSKMYYTSWKHENFVKLFIRKSRRKKQFG
jgi:hypothetical protein